MINELYAEWHTVKHWTRHENRDDKGMASHVGEDWSDSAGIYTAGA